MAAFRTVIAAAILGVVGWLAWQAAWLVRPVPAGAIAGEGARPVRAPRLATNGFLDNAWLARTLALPKGATLMSLNLLDLRGRVLADPQVATATVERNFPDVLSVRITERAPVARLNALAEGGAGHRLFVARDGVVFEGTGFDDATIRSLPWLDSVRLERHGRTFSRIDGMEQVADFLAVARLEAPSLYGTWRVVSLARLPSDHEIDVYSANGLKATFSTAGDFVRQLAALDYVLSAARADPTREVAGVDLTLGGDRSLDWQVPVSYRPPAAAPGVAAVPVAGFAARSLSQTQAPRFVISTHPST